MFRVCTPGCVGSVLPPVAAAPNPALPPTLIIIWGLECSDTASNSPRLSASNAPRSPRPRRLPPRAHAHSEPDAGKRVSPAPRARVISNNKTRNCIIPPPSISRPPVTDSAQPLIVHSPRPDTDRIRRPSPSTVTALLAPTYLAYVLRLRSAPTAILIAMPGRRQSNSQWPVFFAVRLHSPT